MHHTISIAYPSPTVPSISVNYSIEQAEELQTITCVVTDTQVPLWLQLRKFNLLSMRQNGSYVQLFNEANESKNMDTTLFIEKVYAGIMSAERLKVFGTATAKK